jgi:starch phosphorylase
MLSVEPAASTPAMLSGVSLPKRINRLIDLAYNLWWTWNSDASEMFESIDRQLWTECSHNPIKFLKRVKRKELNGALQDPAFLELYDRIIAGFDAYMRDDQTWFARTYPGRKNDLIAYFSTEFGLHESFPTYSGGLGVLSGDHAKEASDLDLPFVGVGLYYNQGYFSQRITEDGWQEAGYIRYSFDDLPIIPLLDADGQPVMVSVELPERRLWVRLWMIQVGRIPLILLDSDITQNAAADRDLTARLYGGDKDTRICQEIVLGIGGVRALRVLNLHPTVWHMNEGHSAFLTFECIRELVVGDGQSPGKDFQTAMAEVRARTVFTTHTPVPAGNEEFPDWMMDRYFHQYWPAMGLTREGLIDLARMQQSWGASFGMSVLALRMSRHSNGVSELHGQVSRGMWKFLYPDTPMERVPIGAITNGVHTGTWLARRMRLLYDRYLGPDWMENLDDPETWQALLAAPDEEIRAARLHLKRKLMAHIRDRARQQWVALGRHPVQIVAAGTLLDPYKLTIGFARRFSTYKRGSLVMRDVDRLLRVVNNPQMPVQIIFAGKAHPMDEPGKRVIQEVYRQLKRAEFAGRVAFLEDYDINLARHLVQGVDVWMNNPRRPLEASGTSGMKASLNGVLNFSILDGWWQEGYNGENGWAIGDESELADHAAQDAKDAASLYDVLENQIVPLYYGDSNTISAGWIRRIKECVSTLAPQFSMRRMVKQYVEEMYFPPAVSANGRK